MKRRGFTLVELVVAIAILGVITLIAIPTINSVQKNNKNTKYKVYDKSINAATKAYTDSYDEDLFGATNTGCAVVNYDDLKKRDLIEDIQIKNNSCSGEDTCVYVRKSKNGNYHYEVHTTCREGSDIVYGTGQKCNLDLCKIEDGKGPQADLIVSPNKDKYFLDDDISIKVRLTDVGIGLREKQVLQYEWFLENRSKTSEMPVEFKNKNYAPRATKKIDMPTSIKDIHEPTVYKLVVSGTVYDVNGNSTEVHIEKEFRFFVGALYIKYKAGGASMIDPHGAAYSVDTSNDHIVSNGNDYRISVIKYKEKADLWNYNNKDFINIAKSYYEIVNNNEWKKESDTYDQGKEYGVSAFGLDDSDLLHDDKEVTVVANWKPIDYTISYDYAGGTASNPTTYNVETETFTLNNPTKLGWVFEGWTGSNGSTKQKTVTIPKGSAGNKSFKANFKLTEPYYNSNGNTFARLDYAVQGTPSGGWIKLIPSITVYNDFSTNLDLKWNKNIDFVFSGQTINLMSDSIVITNGTFNFKSGTIVTSSQFRNAVTVKGGTLNVQGGTLFSPYTTDKEDGMECVALISGNLNLSSGEIRAGSGNSSGYARGVYVMGGTFTMTGGLVYSNATKSGKWGGTGINGSGGNVTITGGTVQTVKGGKARCLICGNGAVIKIKSSNTTLKWGGVVSKGGVIFWKAETLGGSVCIEKSVKIDVVKKGTTYASDGVKWKKSC